MSEKLQQSDFTWHRELCKQCDICQKMCPRQGLKLVDGILMRNQAKCNICGICALYCPDRAIEIKNSKRKTQN
jgi:heterodisulfide reductase subunit A-like polyferredoxin